MNRDMVILSFFTALSLGILILIGVTHKEQLRKLYALAISADFFSVIGNSIGIGIGFWCHPYRVFPHLFNTSIVYDMLFFPATLMLYLVWMPYTRLWKWIYSLLWASSLSVLELCLEKKTLLIHYGKGWTFYKTGLMYLVTYIVFYWLYRWIFGRHPGDPATANNKSD